MDTNKMPEAVRAEFVRAFTNQFGFGVLTASADADAANMLKAAAWAWQASRASLVVSNPFKDCMGDPDAMWAHAVAEKSLKAQGLKVTP